MHSLITGANGFVGSWLAKRLIERGDQVRCLVRPSSDVSALDGLPVETVRGDVTDRASLDAAVKNMNVVFHLAGIRRASHRDDFMRVNAEGTKNVCEAMLMAAKAPARLVFCGSLAASGPGRNPRTEDEPFNPVEWYGDSKAEAERIVLGYANRLPVTIARPARILGAGDRENLFLFKIVRKGVCISIKGGPRPLSVVDVEDVIDALLLLALHPHALGQAFFIANRQTTTFENLQQEAARAMSVHPKIIRIPERTLLALAQVADVVSQISGKRFPLNRKLARQLLAPGWVCSIDKAQELLGFAPKIPIDQSVARSAHWYREKGWL